MRSQYPAVWTLVLALSRLGAAGAGSEGSRGARAGQLLPQTPAGQGWAVAAAS